MARRKRPSPVDGGDVELPAWVLRLRAEDLSRFADESTLLPADLSGEGMARFKADHFMTYFKIRRRWSDACDEWFRQHAPMHPRASWHVRREAQRRGQEGAG